MRKAWSIAGEPAHASYYRLQAESRASAINRYHFDDAKGFYFDYNRTNEEHTNYPTMAAAFALHSKIANPMQADMVAARLEQDFLMTGGFATSRCKTGEQWDGDNGWAPLQQIARSGLLKYGHKTLADEAKIRWLYNIIIALFSIFCFN